MKKFLHVGCGAKNKYDTTREFALWQELRYDIDESVKPQIVGSMTDMSVVRSESVDAIFSSHNLEHLYFHEIPIALTEFYRVITNEGYVVISCPDLQSVCSLVADDKLEEIAYVSPAGPISAVDIIFGYRPAIKSGNFYMAHKSGFTQKTLIEHFESIGFKRTISFTRKNPYFDIWMIAFKEHVSDEIMKKTAAMHFP